MPRVTVWATGQFVGFHRWPGADGNRAYLADRHRHLFVVTAEVMVRHDDRDVEFHDLSDALRQLWGEQPRELGSMSCEAIATDLGEELRDRGMRVVKVEVSEDGENGAVVYW